VKQKRCAEKLMCNLLVLQLADSILRLSEAALRTIDFRRHEASHPRLGTVDHVSCHPLAPPGVVGVAALLALIVCATFLLVLCL
jgi:glutamate formiminotransferase